MIVKKLGLDARPLYLSENISALLRKLVPDAVPGGVIPYSRIIHPADYPAVPGTGTAVRAGASPEL